MKGVDEDQEEEERRRLFDKIWRGGSAVGSGTFGTTLFQRVFIGSQFPTNAAVSLIVPVRSSSFGNSDSTEIASAYAAPRAPVLTQAMDQPLRPSCKYHRRWGSEAFTARLCTPPFVYAYEYASDRPPAYARCRSVSRRKKRSQDGRRVEKKRNQPVSV